MAYENDDVPRPNRERWRIIRLTESWWAFVIVYMNAFHCNSLLSENMPNDLCLSSIFSNVEELGSKHPIHYCGFSTSVWDLWQFRLVDLDDLPQKS